MNLGFPQGPTNLRITVKVNTNEKGEQESVETDFHCDKDNCGKEIAVYSDGANTVHNVVCTEHGLLTSFPNLDAFRKFTEVCVNRILAAKGHGTITDQTNCIPVEDNPDPKAVN